MKIKNLKSTLIGLTLALMLSFGVYSSAAIGMSKSSGVTESEIYICTGPQSKRYHKTKSCRGLKNCSESVVKKSITDAKKLGRRPCGFCYK